MRAVVIGFLGAIAFGGLNGALFHFSSDKDSLLNYGIFGVIPIDWALIGIWMGMIIGFSHRGVDAADGPLTFAAGALAALFCTFVAHAMQFMSIVGGWDINGFITYLGLFGESWKIGPWYMWLSTALATLTGGLAAFGISLAQRADNIRTGMPDWVSPTVRILIHVARVDGHVDNTEANFITALIRAQMLKTLKKVPKDFDNAMSGVVNAEMDAIHAGRTLEHELKEKCFQSADRKVSVAKLAIALAQSDGNVSDKEAEILDKIMAAWQLDQSRRGELAADAMNEFERALA